MLACGVRTLAVVTKDMTLRACGDNDFGQLGIDSTSAVRHLSRVSWPREAEQMYEEVATQMVASSASFLAAVDTSGNVWTSACFKHKTTKAGKMMCMLEMSSPTRIVFVATGTQHCMALSSDMRVFGAGKNFCGQLGTGDTDPRDKLCPIAPGPWMGSTTMLACGGCFSVILADDGAVRTCGQYHSVCLGLGPADLGANGVGANGLGALDRLEPTLVAAFAPGKVDYIAAGAQHVLAIAAGTLYSWGQNCCGQLGVGSFEEQVLPVRVGGEELFGSPVRLVAANQHHTLVLTEQRRLWAFGNGAHGRLGIDRSPLLSLYIKSPEILPRWAFEARILTIAAGKGHSAALTDDGSVYTWGQGKMDEWKGPVPSALGHSIEKPFQAEPLRIPPRFSLRVVSPLCLSLFGISPACSRRFGISLHLAALGMLTALPVRVPGLF